jgi:hypothetical protein
LHKHYATMLFMQHGEDDFIIGSIMTRHHMRP